MAYKCVHCSAVYDDGSKEILTGCGACGGKFFFFIRKEKLQEIKQQQIEEPDLTVTEKKQMEEDVRDIAGVEDEEVPVFLDFESVKIMKPGKYLLDLQKLFERDKPKIYQLEQGKYVVDFSTRVKEEDN